jgi:uncharacterized protein
VDPEQKVLNAGVFSSWLRRTRYLLIKNNGSNVPCGECNACCKSSHFIHIHSDEKDTLLSIPEKWLFAAPYLPKGNKIMGYDSSGCCPMFINNSCSIYEHRSQTCRNYDCRIFTAAGISAGDKTKISINNQLKRWRFQYPARSDRTKHEAVMKAAIFFREHADCFPDSNVPVDPLQIAILALKVYEVFLAFSDKVIRSKDISSGKKIANEIIKINNTFESKLKQS